MRRRTRREFLIWSLRMRKNSKLAFISRWETHSCVRISKQPLQLIDIKIARRSGGTASSQHKVIWLSRPALCQVEANHVKAVCPLVKRLSLAKSKQTISRNKWTSWNKNCWGCDKKSRKQVKSSTMLNANSSKHTNQSSFSKWSCETTSSSKSKSRSSNNAI